MKKAVSNSISKDDDRGTTSCHALLRRMEPVGERLMIGIYVKTQDLIEQADVRVDQGIVEEAYLNSLQLRLQSRSRYHCLLSGKRDEEKRKGRISRKREGIRISIKGTSRDGGPIYFRGSLSSKKVFSDRSFAPLTNWGTRKEKSHISASWVRLSAQKSFFLKKSTWINRRLKSE